MSARPSVADVAAANVCFLTRWRGTASAGAALVRSTSFWHPAKCRFCSVALEEILKRYRVADLDPAQVRAFEQLPPQARAARVREAQEVQWWDQLTATG